MNIPDKRNAAINMDPEEFRKLGHQLVNQVSDFLASLPNRPLTKAETPSEIRKILGHKTLPENGARSVFTVGQESRIANSR